MKAVGPHNLLKTYAHRLYPAMKFGALAGYRRRPHALPLDYSYYILGVEITLFRSLNFVFGTAVIIWVPLWMLSHWDGT